MKKSTILIALCLLLVVALVSGCNSGTSQTTAASGGKMLIVGHSGDAITLDPAQATDSESEMVTSEIMDTLVTYEIGTSKLIPDLATSWESSPDGLSWTFHLRENVKFQDGTPFNADAVVFNFNRWMDKSNQYHKGSFPHFQRDFGGFTDSKDAIIKSVEKIDDNTVKIDLNHPFAPMVNMLTEAAFQIGSPANIKKYDGDIKEHPVGTGAFEFVSWTPNDNIILKKSTVYWGTQAKVDRLQFKVIKDNSARLNALRTGEIDIDDGVNPSDIQTIKNDPKLKMFISKSNNVGYLALNVKIKPFDNVLVRRAINMVVDKKAIIDAYYNGLAEPAVTVLPSTSWAFNDSLTSYPVDIQKAKQLLAQAGFPNGFKTKLWAMPVSRPYMPQPAEIATALQSDMKQIGIDAEIVNYDWATYLKKTAEGDAPMCLLGWSASTWDPTTLLYTLLDGNSAKIPADNVSFYQNKDVDDLLAKALVVSDQSQRADLYKKAQELIHNDAPMVPLVHSEPVWVAGSYVKGFQPQITDGPQFSAVSIEK